MALTALSLLNYGIEITSLNQNLDFKADSLGPELTAVIPLGFYSPQGIVDAIALAMQSVDSANSYSASVSYNYLGGTQNRITIQTTGSFLSLLFSSGSHLTTSIAPYIGFSQLDYTGSTFYVGGSSTGVGLVPEFIGYNYLDDDNQTKVFGAVNVSASGLKEAVVFNFQKFITVDFKYEPKSRLLEWKNFFYWAIQQKPFDFVPEISDPTKVFQVTLEKTSYESKGLGYQMREMLPNFPNFYQTGELMFRIIESTQGII